MKKGTEERKEMNKEKESGKNEKPWKTYTKKTERKNDDQKMKMLI